MPDGTKLSLQKELFEFTEEELSLSPGMAQVLTPGHVAVATHATSVAIPQPALQAEAVTATAEK